MRYASRLCTAVGQESLLGFCFLAGFCLLACLPACLDLLTPREREVLQLLAEGKSSKDIARLLDLSVYTVDTHKSNLMQKLSLHSMSELILYAVRKGIIA